MSRQSLIDLALIGGAALFVLFKVWVVWPPDYPQVDRLVPAACQIDEALRSGRPGLQEPISSLGLPALIVGVAHVIAPPLPGEAAAARCQRLRQVAASLKPWIGVAVAAAVLAMPLVSAALLCLLTGSWRAGVPAAWIAAAFERSTSAIAFGEFESVLAAGLFGVATLILAVSTRTSRIPTAFVAGILFVGAAAIRSQFWLVIPPLVLIVLAVAGIAAGALRRGVSVAAGFTAGFALACIALVHLNQAADGRRIVVTTDNLREIAQRLAIGEETANGGVWRMLWPERYAPYAKVGRSEEIFESLQRGDDHLGGVAQSYAQEFGQRPILSTVQTLLLAAQGLWNIGYIFFIAALFYTPLCWRLARAQNQTATWVAAIGPPLLLMLLGGIVAGGHWVMGLPAIIPIAVIPARVWRGL